ncbi:MAG: T9SS type A sorting domain-containing protein [Bacteroidetes bacterium]|nr:T9SS type A sorting domain-containing protein [Bacteroidota bacterium]
MIIDYLGRTVKQLKVNSEKLIVDVSDLQKGFYTVQIVTNKGNVLNEKLIVE